MSENFDKIIDYIYDNFKYNSTVNYSKIKNLFIIYPVSFDEEDEVLKELSEMKIELSSRNYTKEENEKLLIDCFRENMIVRESELLSMCEMLENNKRECEELRIRFCKSGFSIIDDTSSDLVKSNFDSKEEFRDDTEDEFEPVQDEEYDCVFEYDLDDEFDSLEDRINSEKFREEVNKQIDVPDKKYNRDYLSCYHNLDSDKESKKIASNNLVKANERLVMMVVKKYKRYATSSFDEEDMNQAGMQGLLKAIEKFDESLGYEFSTYAFYWIEQSINRSIIDFSRTIRIPVHMAERINKLTKCENEFLKNNNRKATDYELSKILECSKEKILECRRYRYIYKISSLDSVVGEEEESCLGDFVEDKVNSLVEDDVLNKIYNEQLEQVMVGLLDEREINIIKKRMGFFYGKVYTLEEIGKQENVTRERIRQIEKKALKKIKVHLKKGRLSYEY